MYLYPIRIISPNSHFSLLSRWQPKILFPAAPKFILLQTCLTFNSPADVEAEKARVGVNDGKVPVTTITRYTRSITTITIPCGPRMTHTYIGREDIEVHGNRRRNERDAHAGIIGVQDTVERPNRERPLYTSTKESKSIAAWPRYVCLLLLVYTRV